MLDKDIWSQSTCKGRQLRTTTLYYYCIQTINVPPPLFIIDEKSNHVLYGQHHPTMAGFKFKSSVCVCMCVHMRVCVCACVCVCMLVYVCVRTRVMCVFAHVCVCLHICVCVIAYILCVLFFKLYSTVSIFSTVSNVSLPSPLSLVSPPFLMSLPSPLYHCLKCLYCPLFPFYVLLDM